MKSLLLTGALLFPLTLACSKTQSTRTNNSTPRDNFAAHGNHFGRILDAVEVLARISRLASASPIDLLNEEGEYDVNYIREHGLEYLASAVEITTTRYPNGTQKVTKRIKVEARKGFLELLANFHQLISGDEEARKKALGRALTGMVDPDDDHILSVVTGIPKRLLQSAPLDGPVPEELLEMKDELGTFEVQKPNENGHKNGDGEIAL